MHQAWVLSLLLSTAADAAAPGMAKGDPVVVSLTALSAEPALYAVGNAGPFNRFAFDVLEFDPTDPSAQVDCIYPGNFVYRCAVGFSRDPAAGERRRVTVTIPDLDKGEEIVVRFRTRRGSHDAQIRLANPPQVVHEIEALTLKSGGVTSIGSDGVAAPSTQLVTEQSTTVPAMAASLLGAPASCDQVHAQWVNASATDPVFSSPFGAINGSIMLARPVKHGSAVHGDNLPEWLITYPQSALRVQFIAHYEVIYRVGACAERVGSGVARRSTDT